MTMHVCRSMAAYLGATVEFSKWEGFTFDTQRNRIYTAISEVREGMEDFMDSGEPSDEFDLGGTNDVRLVANPCGCVYAMDVDSVFMATNMYELVCGNTQMNTDESNECDIQSIAGPDNVAYVSGHDGLIIGAPCAQCQMHTDCDSVSGLWRSGVYAPLASPA